MTSRWPSGATYPGEVRQEETVVTRAAMVLGYLFLTTGCHPSVQLDVDRCQANLDLHRLLVATGIPPQGQAMVFPSESEVIAGQLFDSEQETTLTLPMSSQFTDGVCDRLLEELQARCTVESLSGTDFCAFDTRSDPTTGAEGVYLRRASQGRVHLFAAPTRDGRTRIMLTATEWAR
jgi:hypothetical protein